MAPIEPSPGEASHGPKERGRRWLRDGRRGVSPMIATIILLAMTVVLFGGLFFLVNAFPRAPVQSMTQFSAALSYGPCGSGTYAAQVCSISIVHQSGPTISGGSTSQVAIYLSSQNRTSLFGSPFTLAQGGLGGSTWTFGQTWRLSLSSGYNLFAPDNLTASIVVSGQLVFRVILPASSAAYVPYVVNSAVTPSVLSGSSATFNVTVLVHNSSSDPIAKLKVSANVCQLQNNPCANVLMGWAKQTELFYATGTTSADPATGTYYVLVTVTGHGGKSSVTVPVSFTH